MTERGQLPTAPGIRGDLSPAARASGAGLATEQALFHAYRSTVRTPIVSRPCECGGTVHANPAAPARGVQAHNHTGRHKAWRAAREGR